MRGLIAMPVTAVLRGRDRGVREWGVVGEREREDRERGERERREGGRDQPAFLT